MATNYFKTTTPHHHHHTLRRRHSIDCPSATTFLPLKPTPKTTSTTTPPSLNSNSFIKFSLSATTTTTPSTSQTAVSFDLLHQHLSAQNFRQADEETRRLIILLAGEAAQKRGYVFFSEVQFIAGNDLKAIDELWKKYSNKKFGYSVQKQIWEKQSKDFTKFFLKVGWMKKLETEIEQYNYRAFPDEFIWELDEGTPDGHLPLTNALRGTQLLNCILSHPAFDGDGDEEKIGDDEEIIGGKGTESENGGAKREKELISKKVFKADYSF